MALGLTAESKRHNVAGSLDVYISAKLVTIEGLNVAFQGDEFDESGTNEWLDVSYLWGGRDYHRQVGSSNFGNTVEVLISLTCNVKEQGRTNIHRPLQLADLVHKYFPTPQEITINDYVPDPAVAVGTLDVYDIQDFPLGLADGIYRHNLTIYARYLESYTVS